LYGGSIFFCNDDVVFGSTRCEVFSGILTFWVALWVAQIIVVRMSLVFHFVTPIV